MQSRGIALNLRRPIQLFSFATRSLTKMQGLSLEIEELHRIACESGSSTYIDPATGYSVFTKNFHLKRGKCCGSGCRHCPFNHENVPKKRKAPIRSEEKDKT